jgi:uncharacterized membrane protein
MAGVPVDTLLVFVHVPAGVIAVIVGAGAMVAPKGGSAHRWCGRVYLRSLIVVTVTGLGLVAVRGAHFAHLAALGLAAASLGAIGYSARRRPSPSVHIACMGASYIVMLTAFYVDNGPKLPGWRELPAISFWFLPTLVGAPIIARAIRRRAQITSS